MFFKKLVDKKNDKVNFDIIPKTNEEYISVTYGCIRFIDSYRFLSSGLDSLVKTVVDNRDHCHLTGKYTGPAHSKCNINVTQAQSNFIPFILHNFSTVSYTHLTLPTKRIV